MSGTGNDQIFTGVTVANNGTFDMNGVVSEGFTMMTGNGTVVNSGAATSTLQLGEGTAAGNTGTFSGQINDTVGKIALIKTSTGVLTLSGINGYTGGTTINGGTLEVSGSIIGNVTDTAVLKLDNNTALASGATLILAASPAAGAVNLNFTGTQTVNALYYGAAPASSGTWGGTGSGAPASIPPSSAPASSTSPPEDRHRQELGPARATTTPAWAHTLNVSYYQRIHLSRGPRTAKRTKEHLGGCAWHNDYDSLIDRQPSH